MSFLIKLYTLENYKNIVLYHAPKYEIFKIYDLLRKIDLSKEDFKTISKKSFEIRNILLSEGMIEFAPKSNLYVQLTTKGWDKAFDLNKPILNKTPYSKRLEILDDRIDLITNLDRNKNITNPPKEKAETQKPKTLLKEYIGSSKRLITGSAAILFTFVIAPTIFEKYKNEFVSIWDIMVEFFINLFQ